MAVSVESTLLAGLQSSYDALESHDSTKLYFCTDTRNIYKGEILYTDGIRAVTTDPGTPAVGVIYYNTTEDTLKFYNGYSWITVRVAMTSSISSASTNEQIPTAAAVYDYIAQSVNEFFTSSNVVQKVEAGTEDATLSVTTGGEASTITVPGVVTTPTYDSTTRTITLPNSDGTELVIELGKDIYIDSSANNGYDAESGNIVLYLNDGTTIEIPASSLVDIYTGGETSTAKVTVSDDNEITAEVILSTDANNALKVDDTNNGLLLDLSEYAKLSDLSDSSDALDATISALADRVSATEDAIATLNGDNTTVGSVAYQLDQLNSTIEAEISDVEDKADAAQAAADAAQASADSNSVDITTIVVAMGWDSF